MHDTYNEAFRIENTTKREENIMKNKRPFTALTSQREEHNRR